MVCLGLHLATGNCFGVRYLFKRHTGSNYYDILGAILALNSIDDFEAALDEYIKYYNNERIKLKLDVKSPVPYRALQISNH